MVAKSTPAPPAQALTSEAAALTAILAWSSDCPSWQRDALRRLCTQERLEPADIASLLAVCKGKQDGVHLTSAHIRDQAAAGAVVSLSALHGLEYVNALAVGERLTFCKTGLTVIYGDNGAGKSGYARVLKQVCRARSPKNETVLANIYAVDGGTPTGNIDFNLGGQNRSTRWTQGQPSDPSLSAVSVFDSRTANIHVDQTNELAYTPLPLKILAALAQVCQDIKNKLNAEIKALEDQTPAVIAAPDCQPGSAVGKLIGGLSAKTKPEQIAALAGLTPDQKARLTTLQAELASDPALVARQLQALNRKIGDLGVRLLALAAAMTDEQAETFRGATQALRTARAAAMAASTDLFAAEPLPDIGSDVWKTLWEAARVYSRVSAYPEEFFPVTDPGARCVLCLQELDPNAAKRLNRFEVFMQDESKRQEAAAQQAYALARAALEKARFPIKELPAVTAMVRDALGDAALAVELRREILVAAWRLRAILRTPDTVGSFALPRLPILPTAALQSSAADLTKRAAALLEEKSSPARLALVSERDELADRAWLALVKDDVLAQIERLNAIAALTKAARDTTTNRITAISGDIAKALVSNRLRARFAKEVDKLGVAGLAIELQQAKTSQGVPFFQVRLINKPSAPVGHVLSEGEHRCVALAAFLAELATVDAQSAIVFDDPVSSLDHLHREKVAERLAEEGRSRQVIVFTHDMAFLLLLDEACRPSKDREAVPIAYRLISRGEEASGFCHPEPPANVMPLDKVLDAMRGHLGNVRILYQRGDQAKWRREVTSFQEQLRTTWERAVEEAVCPVIKRLARKVDTAGLLKLTVLTQEDCTVMRDAFGRCSALLHSQPADINPPLPSPTVIGAEIDALSSWIDDIRQRQSKVA
jgi:energy-coupling factor transporter ATP-binding protein EcfA2